MFRQNRTVMQLNSVALTVCHFRSSVASRIARYRQICAIG